MSGQSESAEQGIPITGELTRQRGQWYLHITGPRWALDDVRHELEQGQTFAHAAYTPTNSDNRADHLNFVLMRPRLPEPPASGT